MRSDVAGKTTSQREAMGLLLESAAPKSRPCGAA